jgi:hypothetical protein
VSTFGPPEDARPDPRTPRPEPAGIGPDPDQLVLFTSARTEFEGRTIAATLEAAQIPAKVFAAGANMLQWEGGYTDPIKVMVRRADLGRAAAAMKKNKQDSVDLDWSEVDVGQPEPGTVLPPPGGPRFRGTFAMRQVRRIGFIMIGAAMIAGFMAPAAAIPILIGAVTLILAGWNSESKGGPKAAATRGR